MNASVDGKSMERYRASPTKNLKILSEAEFPVHRRERALTDWITL